jgi:hypothetical protein
MKGGKKIQKEFDTELDKEDIRKKKIDKQRAKSIRNKRKQKQNDRQQ